MDNPEKVKEVTFIFSDGSEETYSYMQADLDLVLQALSRIWLVRYQIRNMGRNR